MENQKTFNTVGVLNFMGIHNIIPTDKTIATIVGFPDFIGIHNETLVPSISRIIVGYPDLWEHTTCEFMPYWCR